MAEELHSDNKTVNTQFNATDDSLKNQNNNDIQLTDAKSENKVEDKSKIDASKKSDNTNEHYENMKAELHSRIIDGFKKLKEETGCTNEELLEMLMDMEENKKYYDEEEEEEEEEAPDINDDDCEEQDYGSPEYWENRYRICPEAFDWYQKWDTINNELNQLFTGDELVLNIGCGNSEMSADMQSTTFQTVVSIDISGVVIEQMIEKYKHNQDLLWFEMDCTNLTFEDEFFDIVFDKGTFDAILCGENSIKNVYMSMSEIWRVLKYGGLFIEITYGQPSHRLDLFKNTGLSWKLYEPLIINNDNNDNEQDDNEESERNHYIYIFQKLLNYSDDDDENIDDKNNSENDEIDKNNNDSNVENNNNNNDVDNDENLENSNSDTNNTEQNPGQMDNENKE